MIDLRKYFLWTSLVHVVVILESQAHSVLSTEDQYVVKYMNQRNNLMKAKLSSGSAITLNNEEEAVDALFLKLKSSIISSARVNTTLFPPTEHFFEVKDTVKKSKLFKLIKKLPKAGNLNLHLVGGIDTQWLVKNATYRENCYICYDESGPLFHFFATVEVSKDDNSCITGWKAINQLRPHSGGARVEFDEGLFMLLTLDTPNPKQRYPNKQIVVESLERVTRSVESLLSYRPIYTDGLVKMLVDLLSDNVHYVELRLPKFNLYNTDGTVYGTEEVFNLTQQILDTFKSKHPDFCGAKYIYSITSTNSQQLREELVEYLRLKELYPTLIIGLDMSRESIGLSNMTDDLLTAKNSHNTEMKYFFSMKRNNGHYTTNSEVIDAVLLNSSRIAGALSLTVYPLFMEKIKVRDIAIEISPISDQVLRFINDLRDHPGTGMLSRNLPIVIGTDQGCLLGTKGLSFDYHATLVGMSGEKVALKLLKQMCINSIQYSALQSNEKKHLSDMWSKNWDNFIKATIKEESLIVKPDTSSTGGATVWVPSIHVIGSLLFLFMMHPLCLS